MAQHSAPIAACQHTGPQRGALGFSGYSLRSGGPLCAPFAPCAKWVLMGQESDRDLTCCSCQRVSNQRWGPGDFESLGSSPFWRQQGPAAVLPQMCLRKDRKTLQEKPRLMSHVGQGQSPSNLKRASRHTWLSSHYIVLWKEGHAFHWSYGPRYPSLMGPTCQRSYTDAGDQRPVLGAQVLMYVCNIDI